MGLKHTLVGLSALLGVSQVNCAHDALPAGQDALTSPTVDMAQMQDGSVPQTRAITRAEIAQLLVENAGIPIDTSDGPRFPDVSPDDSAYPYIMTAVKNGIMWGFPDGTFKPSGAQERAIFAKEVVLAFDLAAHTDHGPHFSDVPLDAWFYGYIETLYYWSVVHGEADGSFGPGVLVTHPEADKWIYGAMNPVPRS